MKRFKCIVKFYAGRRTALSFPNYSPTIKIGGTHHSVLIQFIEKPDFGNNRAYMDAPGHVVSTGFIYPLNEGKAVVGAVDIIEEANV